MNNIKQAERDLFFVADSKGFDVSSLFYGKKFSKFPLGVQDYIFNIENYLKDINHFEYLKQYLNNEQIEYLKKYSYNFDLYFLLKDLRILKKSYFLLHYVNVEKAKNQCKIMGLLCGYWQEYKKDQEKYIMWEHKAYYEDVKEVIKGHLGYSSFSFVNEIKLNELFNVFFDIGKKIANNEMSFQDVIDNYSEIMEQLEKKCNELIIKVKTHKIIYNFKGEDIKWSLTA